MNRLIRLTSGLAAALVGWSGIGAVAVAAVGIGLSPSKRLDWRPWILLWSLFYAPLLIWTVISGQILTGLGLLALAVFGVVAGTALRTTAATPHLQWWLLGGLASLAIASIAASYIQPRSLRSYESAEVRTIFSPQGPIELVAANEGGASAHRSWLHAGGSGYVLSGYLRSSSGATPSPGSVTVTLDWPGRTTSAQLSLEPLPEWRPFEVRVSESESGSPEFLIMRIYFSEPGSVEWSSVRLESLSGPNPRAPRSTRQGLLSGHPVLLAHLAIVLVMALIAASGIGFVGLMGILAAVIIGFTSGTRSALAVISIWALLVPFSQTLGRTGKLLAAVLIASIGIGTAFITQEARSEALNSAPSRASIWSVAAESFRETQLLGIEGSGNHAADYFRERTSPPVSHAHNLVLQFASSYGIFGAAAILLFLAALLGLSFRLAGLRGVIITSPLFVLNFFDATLFDTRILVATMLTLAILAVRRADTPMALPTWRKPATLGNYRKEG